MPRSDSAAVKVTVRRETEEDEEAKAGAAFNVTSTGAVRVKSPFAVAPMET